MGGFIYKRVECTGEIVEVWKKNSNNSHKKGKNCDFSRKTRRAFLVRRDRMGERCSKGIYYRNIRAIVHGVNQISAIQSATKYKHHKNNRKGFVLNEAFSMCAEHGISLAGESPATGIYRQV